MATGRIRKILVVSALAAALGAAWGHASSTTAPTKVATASKPTRVTWKFRLGGVNAWEYDATVRGALDAVTIFASDHAGTPPGQVVPRYAAPGLAHLGVSLDRSKFASEFDGVTRQGRIAPQVGLTRLVAAWNVPDLPSLELPINQTDNLCGPSIVRHRTPERWEPTPTTPLPDAPPFTWACDLSHYMWQSGGYDGYVARETDEATVNDFVSKMADRPPDFFYAEVARTEASNKCRLIFLPDGIVKTATDSTSCQVSQQ